MFLAEADIASYPHAPAWTKGKGYFISLQEGVSPMGWLIPVNLNTGKVNVGRLSQVLDNKK